VIADGVPAISINDEPPKKLKNSSSRRIIPIHPTLLKLGFLNYVESVRRATTGNGPIFPELTRERDGFSQRVSKWFARYKQRCGIDDSSKVFHSFRHTVANHLKQKGVPKEHAAALLGHSDGSMTYGTYGQKYSASFLVQVVEQIRYDLEISHLFVKSCNRYI
jgi:integrase